jgi:hypothetical protein
MTEFRRFVDIAAEYAKARWCLDDSELIREWVTDQWPRCKSESPGALVDYYAHKFDLLEPYQPKGWSALLRRRIPEHPTFYTDEQLAELESNYVEDAA